MKLTELKKGQSAIIKRIGSIGELKKEINRLRD